MSFLKRWWIFLKERHEPFGITIMILGFFAANGFMAYQAGVHAPPCWKRLAAGFALIWLIFLHMRLFDEVKDYDFDKEYNPDRPLAKGIISLDEFGAMTLVCLLVEMLIAGSMKWPIFPAYIMVLCFTLMMRMEFFVGDWMRPKLELYAGTHTFSATMIGMLIHTIVCFSDFAGADKAFLAFAIGNWFVFNVFEFGRKTFGKEEEREGVDSYSERLKPSGAVGLLLINIIGAFVCLHYSATIRFGIIANNLLIPAGIISLLVTIPGIIYAIKPQQKMAKIYRGCVALYLLAYPSAIAISSYLSAFK